MARRTPLYEAHRALGARMVEFAGWEMPIAYGGPTDEHQAVRTRCGLFDVSHMGEIELTGSGAAALCQHLTVNDVGRLGPGDAQYTLLCREDGGVIDDLILYRLAPDRFLLVVNAAGTTTDLAWISAHAGKDVVVEDRSAATALLALQGPAAAEVLSELAVPGVQDLRPFGARRARIGGIEAFVSRTGYTGEDGFEIFLDAAAAMPAWDDILGTVRRFGGMPAGLAARDTLRLEAGLPLYGADMDVSTSPLEAGLAWVVRFDKGPFVGRERMIKEADVGVRRSLVGIELDAPGIPRHGFAIWRNEERVGEVTSGARSPTLGTFIGMAYVRGDVARVGAAVAVDIRGRRVPGRIVRRPFYRHATR